MIYVLKILISGYQQLFFSLHDTLLLQETVYTSPNLGPDFFYFFSDTEQVTPHTATDSTPYNLLMTFVQNPC